MAGASPELLREKYLVHIPTQEWGSSVCQKDSWDLLFKAQIDPRRAAGGLVLLATGKGIPWAAEPSSPLRS